MPFDGQVLRSSFHSEARSLKSSPSFESPSRAKLVPRVRRLSDDLRWRCAACHKLVPTKETHFHLIGCLMTLVNPNAKRLSEKSSPNRKPICKCATSSNQDQKLDCMDRGQGHRGGTRPRTKRLERATPNIKHPVIAASRGTTAAADKKDPHHVRIEDNKVKAVSPSLPKSKSIENAQKKYMSALSVSNPEPIDSLLVKSKSLVSIDVTKHSTITLDTNDLTAKRKGILERLVGKNGSPMLPKKYPSLEVTTEVSEKKPDEEVFPNASPVKKDTVNGDKKVDERSKSEKATKKSDQVVVGAKSGCDPAGWDHFKSQLVPCPKCARNFFPRRLPIHERSCRDYRQSQTNNANKDDATPKTDVQNEKTPANKTCKSSQATSKTLFTSCQKCAKRFSNNSIALHELRCKSGAKEEKSKEEGDEAKEPVDPEWESHLQVLKPCARCHRTFFPDRLLIHAPVCKADPVGQAVK